ncbi:MAG: hypothetical protein ABGY43_11085 [bacterium]|nr:hypothetical protein [Gammaproteobacteria bacterium]HIL82942.1 hypothetical protein [Pseudomonadales bacterium]
MSETLERKPKRRKQMAEFQGEKAEFMSNIFFDLGEPSCFKVCGQRGAEPVMDHDRVLRGQLGIPPDPEGARKLMCQVPPAS